VRSTVTRKSIGGATESAPEKSRGVPSDDTVFRERSVCYLPGPAGPPDCAATVGRRGGDAPVGTHDRVGLAGAKRYGRVGLVALETSDLLVVLPPTG